MTCEAINITVHNVVSSAMAFKSNNFVKTNRNPVCLWRYFYWKTLANSYFEFCTGCEYGDRFPWCPNHVKGPEYCASESDAKQCCRSCEPYIRNRFAYQGNIVKKC